MKINLEKLPTMLHNLCNDFKLSANSNQVDPILEKTHCSPFAEKKILNFAKVCVLDN